jgi:hypothetical protein
MNAGGASGELSEGEYVDTITVTGEENSEIIESFQIIDEES